MMETPDSVDTEDRVFHESQIPPGTIARKHYEDRHDELKTGGWFLVVTEPERSDRTGSEYVEVYYLTGDKSGTKKRKFLRDLGAAPPYRCVMERHEWSIHPSLISPEESSGRWKLSLTIVGAGLTLASSGLMGTVGPVYQPADVLLISGGVGIGFILVVLVSTVASRYV